ncbi:efflux RND transporter periplasmic adaptor subunit [Aeromonas enteropelogenes]|uniref:efflux RND transporter periplasmic adaptor subunit n=1 Tax=Aeromonas enteropelogenes TaxID=29489 RepID=UPI0022857F40|nr:efflux RND transporter periplasmic adaptor subunit [Aeromonas enteropelogenes]MCZ0750495.1 efflux RND transporter periplasmic adaptor subunit [Aeromonas enteropelogenes]
MQYPLFSPSCLSVLILGGLLTGCGTDTATEVVKPPRPVNAMQLSDSKSLYSLKFSGEIKSHQSASLAFRVPGTLEQILVKEGDRVSEGQVIARLDPHDFRVQRDAIKAQLSEAKAAYKLAVVELSRTRQAVQDRAMASINLERATSVQNQANARVQMLQQSLKQAEDALAYSELKAPFDGIIGQRFIEEHEQTSPGQPVFSLHQPTALDAVVDVPEQQIGQMRSGMQANVTWYRQEASVKAVSTEIASLPDPLKRTYKVTFKLLNNSPELVPGKSINVELALPASERIYCLPATAIKSQGGQPQVVAIKSKAATHVPVTIVSQRHDTLCVEGELNAGDQIVTAGSALLKEGQAIAVINQVDGQS